MAHTKLFFENGLRRTIHVRIAANRGTLEIHVHRADTHGAFPIAAGKTVWLEVDDRIKSCKHPIPGKPKSKATLRYEIVQQRKQKVAFSFMADRYDEGPLFIFEEPPN